MVYNTHPESSIAERIARRTIVKEDEFAFDSNDVREIDALLQSFAEQDRREASISQLAETVLEQGERDFDDFGHRKRLLAKYGNPGSHISQDDIVRNIGSVPRIYGLDQCQQFRSLIPNVKERKIASTGLYHSGSQLMTQLLKHNCILRQPRDFDSDSNSSKHPTESGVLPEVPWSVNKPARSRHVYAVKSLAHINITAVLPIVIIRNPYKWMASMCGKKYHARWETFKSCPHLVKNTRSMKPITVKISNNTYPSLAHLWNQWYHQYWKEANFPFLMVRYEDLIFHTQKVIAEICGCAGGAIRTDRPFYYNSIAEPTSNLTITKERLNDIVWAWMTQGGDLPIRGNFSKLDYKAARMFLDNELMQTFGYMHPQPL